LYGPTYFCNIAFSSPGLENIINFLFIALAFVYDYRSFPK
jgi:hypothetical protein